MDIIELRTFIAILDEGSFAAAARRLGISRSLSSKHISDLEEELGTRLLVRTTREVHATAVGAEFGENLRLILAQLDAATDNVRAASDKPAGVLRIGSPVAYTLKVLQPHLVKFMELYPGIKLNLTLDDGTSDLVSEGFDAVIRIGFLKDSSLRARKLDSARIMLVASPEYLELHGTPVEPNDLLHHGCLHYTNLRGTSWPLIRDGQTLLQRIEPVFSSNNTELLHSMAVSGRGITILPEFVATDEIAKGTLIPLMQDYTIPNLPISIVYPPGKLLTTAMRSFLDFAATLKLG
ncbi:LysR family transcriptional regulator [Paracoccus caeni]|uniref:LysR family transcriptional regulator n=1 Tax=Paracoccus caeni TaxID=657651 RepID=A0A934VZ13_9RHOB|nr:LysR family transcriptional regulator [Paracoccus caeni]MBK4216572.1 LysR family transcriptional regulator [Paracoccus caeni]